MYIAKLKKNPSKKKSSKVTINVKFIFSFYDLHLEITLDRKTCKVDVSLEIPFNLSSLWNVTQKRSKHV